MHRFTRRQFMLQSTALIAAVSVSNLRAAPEMQPVAKTMNASPAQLASKAIELLGGISAFVKPGQTVLIKPNIGWDRLPEQAATTNPDMVAEVISLCRKAGAKKIRVLDRSCNQARRCYRRSGIETAAKKAGAEVRFVIDSRFKNVKIPGGKALASWPICRDALDFDVLINMPIAKVHSLSGVTLGMKNLMGLLGGDRGELHRDFSEKIVDINTVIRPTLTIVDAYRVLMHNGPSGGSLDDVVRKAMVFAGRDAVGVDAFAASLFDIPATALDYLLKAENRGLGHRETGAARLKTFDFRA